MIKEQTSQSLAKEYIKEDHDFQVEKSGLLHKLTHAIKSAEQVNKMSNQTKQDKAKCLLAIRDYLIHYTNSHISPLDMAIVSGSLMSNDDRFNLMDKYQVKLLLRNKIFKDLRHFNAKNFNDICYDIVGMFHLRNVLYFVQMDNDHDYQVWISTPDELISKLQNIITNLKKLSQIIQNN